MIAHGQSAVKEVLMPKAILGKKIGMTQIFSEEGNLIPVTVIEAEPNTVTQIKTVENDGYAAVQIGYSNLKENRANKPTKGHFEKWGAPLKKHIAEFRLAEGESYEAGQVITVEDFQVGSFLDITGVSKGKGTQGNIKRHGHHRGPMTHGSKHKRLAGALAAGTYPSRVFKGNAGPGRMGRDTVTVQNLELVGIVPERNAMLVKGAVPGKRGGLLRICYAVKREAPVDAPPAATQDAQAETPAGAGE
jgi:large subunit ribosomal protein L3